MGKVKIRLYVVAQPKEGCKEGELRGDLEWLVKKFLERVGMDCEVKKVKWLFLGAERRR